MTVPKADDVLDAWQGDATTMNELAERFNTSQATISIILRSHRAEGTRAGPQHFDETPWRDESELRRLYQEEEMTQEEIADNLGVSETTIRNWMKRHGIERRCGATAEGRYTDKEWLREQYVEKELSCHEVAQKCDVVNGTIRTWLIKHDIPRRSPGKS